MYVFQKFELGFIRVPLLIILYYINIYKFISLLIIISEFYPKYKRKHFALLPKFDNGIHKQSLLENFQIYHYIFKVEFFLHLTNKTKNLKINMFKIRKI